MAKQFSVRDILIPEIDYNFLRGQLRDYADPWGKIGDLLKSGELVRVKKGLYVLGDRKKPFSLPVLANMIYGPSYVSLEFALAFHGLIPERVQQVTSVTPKRHKHFSTPVADFSYDYQNFRRYSVGFTRQEIDNHRGFLIATPEKALVDSIWQKTDLSSKKQLREFLFDDLRIDKAELRKFRTGLLKDLQERFNVPVVSLLLEAVRELK